MGERSVGLAAALLADLREVAVDLAEGGYSPSTVAMLQRNLRRSVPSALGVTVTVVADGCPEGQPVHVHLVDRPVPVAGILSARGDAELGRVLRG